jgi:hypothetical protein
MRPASAGSQELYRQLQTVLDVRCVYSLPVFATLRHAHASGNPGSECHGDWRPAGAGVRFSWRRACAMDIESDEGLDAVWAIDTLGVAEGLRYNST